MMRRALPLFLVLAACKSSVQISASLKSTPETAVVGEVPLASNRNIFAGKHPEGGKDEILVSHKTYVLSWNKARRDPNWVMWNLTEQDFGSSGRSNTFAVDPALNVAVSNAVQPNEYVGSCFDRGHEAPSADRTDSVPDNEQTFYMSNMTPQSAHLNRIVWEHLEDRERELARSEHSIYIIAGSVFGSPERSIHGIAVPVKSFKVILNTTGKVLEAVSIPNFTSTGTDAFTDHAQACDDEHKIRGGRSGDDWKAFRVPINTIEAETGLKIGS